MRLPSVAERRFPFKTDAGTLLYPGLDCLRRVRTAIRFAPVIFSLGDFLNNLAPPNPFLQIQFQLVEKIEQHPLHPLKAGYTIHSVENIAPRNGFNL